MVFDDFLEIPPYSLEKKEKTDILNERLNELTGLHAKKCIEYRRMINSMSYDDYKFDNYPDIPFLPVRLFKELSLKSIGNDEVVKTMTSSGTTGQSVSKIYLDRTTASNQQKALIKIVSSFIGNERIPMIIVDCPSVVKNRRMFSARGAGILGFSMFGSERIYALKDEDMSLDIEKLKEFLDKHKGKKILLFGFTFIIWQHFYAELLKLKQQNIEFDLSTGILIHGGGWKKLQNESVSSSEYKKRLNEVCGIKRVHEYYGMVEQTGCIYMECEHGHLHASNFSDIIIRNPKDFSECNIGEKGIIQVLSTIPESYPGHSLLTEDEGILLGEDDCNCGRKGKYFKINGRIKNAEIRGCSDTYSVKISHNSEENSDNINYLIGDEGIIEKMKNAVQVKEPFCEEVVEFCDFFSKEVFAIPEAKEFPDIIALGFWLRKSNILSLKSKHINNDDSIIKLGRGIVFHVAPSNVPLNFAYSLFSSLICGNYNVVKISTKEFRQVGIVIKALKKTIQQFPIFKEYICIVRYLHSDSINAMFSSICNVRIIWGGDNTISEIRKTPLLPRANEITFASRYSVALIDSRYYLNIDDKNSIAKKFWNDTFLNDQNACTSPKKVIFIGEKVDNEEARRSFWNIMLNYVNKKYKLSSFQAVDKLSKFYLISNAVSGVLLMPMPNNIIYRIYVSNSIKIDMNYDVNSGFFFEYLCSEYSDIIPLCNNIKCQTIGYIGDKSIIKNIIKSGVIGIDRIVPIGSTLDFNLIWDGYNLVEMLTRSIIIY